MIRSGANEATQTGPRASVERGVRFHSGLAAVLVQSPGICTASWECIDWEPKEAGRICNLYRLTAPASAIAAFFDSAPADGANHAWTLSPTDPGLVVARGKVQAMGWGFPRIADSKVTGQRLKPTAVANTRSDRIGSPFWLASFQRRRCLIPAAAWAEAAGEKGCMTRTWFSLPGEEIFAIAGIWCNSPEWGHVYSMLMVPGHPLMEPLNDRMPVILRREDWKTWTDGTPTAAHALCRTWDAPLTVEPTCQPWSDRARPLAPPITQLSLPL